MSLRPVYTLSAQLVSDGGGSIVFAAVDATLEAKLMPFLRGEPGPQGPAGQPGAGLTWSTSDW